MMIFGLFLYAAVDALSHKKNIRYKKHHMKYKDTKKERTEYLQSPDQSLARTYAALAEFQC